MGASIDRGASCASPARLASAAAPRKTVPNTLTKQAAASAADEGEHRRRPARRSAAGRRRRRRSGAQRGQVDAATRETKPLSGGSPQMAAAPTRKSAAVQRHGPREPAQVVEVARAGGVDHRAGAEEEQALEDGVVHHVEDGGREARGAPAPASPAGPPQERQPQRPWR